MAHDFKLSIVDPDVTDHRPGEGPGKGLEPARKIMAMGTELTDCDPDAGLLLSEMERNLRNYVFERVIRMSGGRSEARGADALIHHASTVRVVVDGRPLIGRLVGVPILCSEGDVDPGILTGNDDDGSPCAVAEDAFAEMGSCFGHSGIEGARILPILPDGRYLNPGHVGELLAGAKAWIQKALAPSAGAGGRTRIKAAKIDGRTARSYRRLVPSRMPEGLRFHRDHGAHDDRVVTALALGIVLGEETVALGPQIGGSMTPSSRHPGIWYGSAQPFAHAVSDLMALGTLAKLRRRCGAPPFASGGPETLHVCERIGELHMTRELFYALETADGVGTATPTGNDFAWHGASFMEAIRRSVSGVVVHESATGMPASRMVGEPDPRTMPADRIAEEALKRGLGLGDVAGAFGRIYREPGGKRPSPIGNRTVAEFVGVPVLWTPFDNRSPAPTTIGAVIKKAGSWVASGIMRLLGDSCPEPGRSENVAAAWVRQVHALPLMQLLVDDGFDATLLKQLDDAADDEPSTDAKSIDLDAGDGYHARVTSQRGQDGSEDLSFTHVSSDLLTGSGEIFSASFITVVRKRRRSTRLTSKDFMLDMDTQSDELTSIGVKLLEVARGPNRLFAKGDLVVLRWYATRDDVRRLGHANRLLRTVLAELKKRYPGIGTLIVPIAAPSMRITPGENAPADLSMRYQALTASTRRMFTGPNRFAEQLGADSRVICFDEGAALNQVEFAVRVR